MTCAVWSKTCSTLVWLRASPKSHCLRNRNIFSHLLKTFLPRSEGQLTQFYQNARAKPSPKRRMPNKNNFKLNWTKGCGSFGDRRPDEARAISTKTMGFPHVPRCRSGQSFPRRWSPSLSVGQLVRQRPKQRPVAKPRRPTREMRRSEIAAFKTGN